MKVMLSIIIVFTVLTLWTSISLCFKTRKNRIAFIVSDDYKYSMYSGYGLIATSIFIFITLVDYQSFGMIKKSSQSSVYLGVVILVNGINSVINAYTRDSICNEFVVTQRRTFSWDQISGYTWLEEVSDLKSSEIVHYKLTFNLNVKYIDKWNVTENDKRMILLIKTADKEIIDNHLREVIRISIN